MGSRPRRSPGAARDGFGNRGRAAPLLVEPPQQIEHERLELPRHRLLDVVERARLQ
jgi:hypothetical protein